MLEYSFSLKVGIKVGEYNSIDKDIVMYKGRGSNSGFATYSA